MAIDIVWLTPPLRPSCPSHFRGRKAWAEAEGGVM